MGRTAGPERSVYHRVHQHPPVTGQSVSAGRNNSEPGHGTIASIGDDCLWDCVSTVCNNEGVSFQKLRNIPHFTATMSEQKG